MIRPAAWRAREAQASLEEFHSSRGSRGGRCDLSLEQIEVLLKDAWLAPIESRGLLITQGAAEVVVSSCELEDTGESDPSGLVQHLRTYGLDPDRWTAAVDNFDEWFGRAVGSVERLRELLDRSGDRWVKGMRNCRATFG